MARNPKAIKPAEPEAPVLEEAPAPVPAPENFSRKEDPTVAVIAQVDLFEPGFRIRLPKGVRVELPRMTNWMQCQIDAKLLEKVS